MSKIILHHTKQEIEVAEGQDIRSALEANDIYVKSSCGGKGSCSDCMIKIVTGEDNITPMSFEEIKHLGNVFHITKERLSCQTKLTGDVMIDITHHDQDRDRNKIATKKNNFRVRKKEQIDELKAEREKEWEEKDAVKAEKEQKWEKHWEKEHDPMKPKKLGGGRRPKPFSTPDPVDEEPIGSEEGTSSDQESKDNDE